MNELSLAKAALTKSWRSIRGQDSFGIETHPSYVSNSNYNLLSRVEPRDFEDDLRKGGGRELDWYNAGRSPPKFNAAYSSSALAVNTFGPFRRQSHDLAVGGLIGFKSVCFEAKLPTGVSVPNIDVLCKGNAVLAIEAKCLEYLRPGETSDARRLSRKAPFSPKYRTVENMLDDNYGKLYEAINANFGAFAPVGVTQIVKHYLGLKKSQQGNIPVTMLYLFWEPSDRDQYPVFAHHRDQIDKVGDLLRGSSVRFLALSYHELWQEMVTRVPASWVADHVSELKRRYEVPLVTTAVP